jgi:uncharacterized membrane protein YkoI
MAIRERPVKSGDAAIRIARNVADDAGLVFYSVERAYKTKRGVWIVYIASFENRYRTEIDAKTGEVMTWKKQ